MTSVVSAEEELKKKSSWIDSWQERDKKDVHPSHALEIVSLSDALLAVEKVREETKLEMQEKYFEFAKNAFKSEKKKLIDSAVLFRTTKIFEAIDEKIKEASDNQCCFDEYFADDEDGTSVYEKLKSRFLKEGQR
jgi:hypothetical protein